jgi:Short C-terminal domain
MPFDIYRKVYSLIAVRLANPVPSVRSAPERLRALEQLKTDGLINEEEYNAKRKEILGEL